MRTTRKLLVAVGALVAALAGAVPATAAPVAPGPGIVVPPLCVRTVDVGDRTAAEGTRAGTGSDPYTYFSFPVTSRGCAVAGTVSFLTFAGTATAGIDYLGLSTTVRFESGSLATRYVTVRVVKDGSPGPDETFVALLGSSSSLVKVDDGAGSARWSG